jgi:hypothetical protein
VTPAFVLMMRRQCLLHVAWVWVAVGCLMACRRVPNFEQEATDLLCFCFVSLDSGGGSSSSKHGSLQSVWSRAKQAPFLLLLVLVRWVVVLPIAKRRQVCGKLLCR